MAGLFKIADSNQNNEGTEEPGASIHTGWRNFLERIMIWIRWETVNNNAGYHNRATSTGPILSLALTEIY